jgi:hypothetical protein
MFYKAFILTILTTISAGLYAQDLIEGKQAVEILKNLPLNKGAVAFMGEVKCTVLFTASGGPKGIQTSCVALAQQADGIVEKKEVQDDKNLYSLLDVKIDLEDESHTKHAFVDCSGKVKTNIFGNEKISQATCAVDDLY